MIPSPNGREIGRSSLCPLLLPTLLSEALLRSDVSTQSLSAAAGAKVRLRRWYDIFFSASTNFPIFPLILDPILCFSGGNSRRPPYFPNKII